MVTYKGKSIYDGNLADGNPYRQQYIDSINAFIEKEISRSFKKRDSFIENIVSGQDEYRAQYLKMIGSPVTPYPDYIPEAKTEFTGTDEFCDIYRLQIEVMSDFWFYGILMVPHGISNAPLVIAQHGGGSTPEICSDFLGRSNYSFFTKRALERGMVVFAPQLLLWNFNLPTGEPKFQVDSPYDRDEIDQKLKHLGLSLTGLEVFCLRRSVDYLHSLEYIDKERTAMLGLSYGGYFSLHTAAADTRIKSIYAAGFFNDRSQICFGDWKYKDSLNTFCDAEVAALCAPRRLQIDVGKSDTVFDYSPSVAEAKRAQKYYEKFGVPENFIYNLWDGEHRFDETEKGFDLFFDGI